MSKLGDFLETKAVSIHSLVAGTIDKLESDLAELKPTLSSENIAMYGDAINVWKKMKKQLEILMAEL